MGGCDAIWGQKDIIPEVYGVLKIPASNGAGQHHDEGAGQHHDQHSNLSPCLGASLNQFLSPSSSPFPFYSPVHGLCAKLHPPHPCSLHLCQLLSSIALRHLDSRKHFSLIQGHLLPPWILGLPVANCESCPVAQATVAASSCLWPNMLHSGESLPGPGSCSTTPSCVPECHINFLNKYSFHNRAVCLAFPPHPSSNEIRATYMVVTPPFIFTR